MSQLVYNNKHLIYGDDVATSRERWIILGTPSNELELFLTLTGAPTTGVGLYVQGFVYDPESEYAWTNCPVTPSDGWRPMANNPSYGNCQDFGGWGSVVYPSWEEEVEMVLFVAENESDEYENLYLTVEMTNE